MRESARRVQGALVPGRKTVPQVLHAAINEARHFRRTFKLLRHFTDTLEATFFGEFAMLGGGTLINEAVYLDAYKAERQRTKRLVPVFSSGVSDPRFWSVYPGWSDTRREWAKVLAELPLVGVRGPRSAELLRDAGLENVRITGDPALELHQPMHASTLEPLTSHNIMLGINIGDSHGRMWGSLEKTLKEVGRFAQMWLDSGRQLKLISVWPEDDVVCRELVKIAHRGQLSITTATTHDQFFAAMVDLDVMLTMKLHASVLAAAASVPFVSMEYQPKCSDFTESIGWRHSIRTDQVTAMGLWELTSTLIANYDSMRKRLCTEVCRMQKEFRLYCDSLQTFMAS